MASQWAERHFSLACSQAPDILLTAQTVRSQNAFLKSSEPDTPWQYLPRGPERVQVSRQRPFWSSACMEQTALLSAGGCVTDLASTGRLRIPTLCVREPDPGRHLRTSTPSYLGVARNAVHFAIQGYRRMMKDVLLHRAPASR